MEGSVGGLDTPLEISSRVDDIADRLITAIAVGEYLPGSRLPSERDLAASLRVGRMTVRAAISRLVREGLLRTQRGRGGGSFVQSSLPAAAGNSAHPAVHRVLGSRWEVLKDTSEAIAHLQGAVCRAAAENRSEDDIAVLEQCLEAFRRAASGSESQIADELLHLAIGAAAHNHTLSALLLDLEARVSISAPRHPWGDAEGMRRMEERALRDHEKLIAAITGQRSAEAGDLGRMHARIDLEMLDNALRRSAPESTEMNTRAKQKQDGN
ncbi:GntR family transcriptional regulator [Arthrobacter yangruifuii]|uniref:GntR family transcriptional regulator n=1 Tax=Arthrobacter yangruifuii TaxID=2606616 RepID=A0A5N6MFV9_9MICC|nr:GntR family transcriptional regulator [Arthrobacter yangruifuii]KAD3515113.1 GntR family transcriptional regulator [Arthrobacter yangruifuii]